MYVGCIRLRVCSRYSVTQRYIGMYIGYIRLRVCRWVFGTSWGYVGDCQSYGPFLGPYYNTGPNLGDPKRDHDFDNLQCEMQRDIKVV